MYTILITDDSILDIQCLTFLIEKYNLPLQVTTAMDGEAALTLLTNTHFDILLTDIKMPFIDGLELSQKTRNISPDTRIILFSGYNDFEYAKTAISIGVQDYLMKPVSAQDFKATIHRVIGSISEERKTQKEFLKQAEMAKCHLLWLAVNNALPSEHLDLLYHYYSLILIECENEVFNQEGTDFQKILESNLSLSFDYLNLYPTRNLLFLREKKQDKELLSISLNICNLAENSYHKKFRVSFDNLENNVSIYDIYNKLERKTESSCSFSQKELPNSLYKTDKIKEYIYENYSKSLTLDEIAKQFYISPNYLCSLFKNENGQSVFQFINNYRLARACDLLVSSQMKINKVCQAVGFQNASYFCQRFRDAFGETPERYRQKHSR